MTWRRKTRAAREIAEAEREMNKLQSEFAHYDSRLKAAEDKSSSAGHGGRTHTTLKMVCSRPFGCGGTGELGVLFCRFGGAGSAYLEHCRRGADAARAIEYLKRSQIGRAVSSYWAAGPGQPFGQAQLRGIVDYAFRLIDFDPKFQGAFWYVFRDTLVVESLNARLS